MIFELSRANKANPREALGSTILIFDYGVSPLFDTQPLICLDSGLVKSTSGSNVYQISMNNTLCIPVTRSRQLKTFIGFREINIWQRVRLCSAELAIWWLSRNWNGPTRPKQTLQQLPRQAPPQCWLDQGREVVGKPRNFWCFSFGGCMVSNCQAPYKWFVWSF